jgi:predicted DNA-binding transcriptional regulator AlpA
VGNTTKTTKAAQIEPSKKTTAIKKRAQLPWLRELARQLPPLIDDEADHVTLGRGAPRLLSKNQVCAIAGTTFPTIWIWMRAGTFPRSRVVGGRSMWLSTEIDKWMAALPVRVLKGDQPREVA